MMPDGADDLMALGRDGKSGGVMEAGAVMEALLALQDGLLQPFLKAGKLLMKPLSSPAALAQLVESPAGGRAVAQHRPRQ